MKRGRLPLTQLRSFEAAGRLASFSRAADELHVSQAAISRQVRELEQVVGRPLFERLHRRVVLTETGSRLLRQLTASFDAIDRELSAILETARQTILKVSVEPAFAGEFLVRRLNAFQALHPDIEISIDSDSRVVAFRDSEAELAIRYGAVAQSWPQVEALHLFDLKLTPLASPALLGGGVPLRTADDLLGYTLVHDESRDGWSRWFRAAGIDVSPQRGPIYADASLTMQAARLGHGVALGDKVLNGDDIVSGGLVTPFDLDVPYGAYWLVAPKMSALSSQAGAFVAWLEAEVAAARTRSQPLAPFGGSIR